MKDLDSYVIVGEDYTIEGKMLHCFAKTIQDSARYNVANYIFKFLYQFNNKDFFIDLEIYSKYDYLSDYKIILLNKIKEIENWDS